MHKFRLGLIVNPFAGIGGELALKGSDGQYIRHQAMAAGAEQKAMQKASLALAQIAELASQVSIVTASGDMGENSLQAAGLPYRIGYRPNENQTEPEDTIKAAKYMLEQQVDLLLFAGGDGTARNICEVVQEQIPVLGIPAGCKIHSGVYAVTPAAAGKVVAKMIRGELVSKQLADVRDIDESQFRAGRVIAKPYGEMHIPTDLAYVQATKMGGKEHQELVLADLAAQLQEWMDDFEDAYFVMGSGSTIDFMMNELGFSNTLLGVDVVYSGQVIASDVTATELCQLLEGKNVKLVVTLIGGQGHVFGRGNQQLSSVFIRRLEREDIFIVATKQKLESLQGRPMISDSGDATLDRLLSGSMTVTTGYHDQVLYPLQSPGNDDGI